MKSIILITILAVFFSGCMILAEELTAEDYFIVDDYPINSVDSETASSYKSIIDNATSNGYPGSAMLIDSPAGFWSGAGGLADIANNIPMSKNQLFRIGSVTKPFTAALILILEEEGELNIEDKISEYLPAEMVNKVANAKEATITQLLNHTSGIPNNYGVELTGLDYAAEQLNHFNDFELSKEEMVSFIYGMPASFAVGTDWAYSNTNYVLLALIAEEAAGSTFGELLRDRILLPLGLDNTTFDTQGNSPVGLARGYDALYGDDRLYDVSEDTLGLGGDGGIISNTKELARFFRAVMNLELFGQAQLDKMLTQYPYNSWGTSPVETSGYALGLFFEAKDGVADYYAHYGYVYGYGSDLYYFPHSDTVVVYLTNMTNNPQARENIEPVMDLLWSFM